MKPKTFIQEFPPRDGKSYDCQCARCGSTADWVHCWECEDGYYEDDVGDDVVPEYVTVECETCRGHGGRYRCMSSPEWCEANPLRGRKDVPRGKLEWFEDYP